MLTQGDEKTYVSVPSPGAMYSHNRTPRWDVAQYLLGPRTVGQRFRVASQYAVDILAREQLQEDRTHQFPQHGYEVVDRIDNGNVLVVRADYVEQGTSGGAVA